MKVIETAFKKLLGKGRAFIAPQGFMSEFLDVLVSPISDIKDRILNLKFTHFPTTNIDENDIANGEELFGIKDTAGKSLKERASNVEAQWSIFGGSQTFKQIETILRRTIPLKVSEEIMPKKKLHGARLIGNGFVTISDGKKPDPITYNNGKEIFTIQSEEFYNESDFLNIAETVAKNKPAHNGAFFIPRYLKKKEINGKMTKREMQEMLKKYYCDVRVHGEH